MSVTITIDNTVIQFPSTGESAVWSEPIIQFAQAVEEALLASGNPYDIASTVYTLTSNSNTNLDLKGTGEPLEFASGVVASFVFNYSVYRVSSNPSGMSQIQVGTVSGVFDDDAGAWSLQHEFAGDTQSDGTAYVTFDMVGDNLTLSSTAITGTYDSTNSKISYSAQTQLVTV